MTGGEKGYTVGEGGEDKEEKMKEEREMILREIREELMDLEMLRKEIEKFAINNIKSFSESDIRFHFPNQINRVLIFNNLNLSYFERVIWNKDELDKILPTPTNEDHLFVMENYFKMVRLNLAINICTILENYIRKLCESLEKKDNNNEHIFKLRKRVFEMLRIEEGHDLRNAQTILFEIRNGIHSNSVFSKKKIKIKETIFYANKLHIFKIGTPLISADLATLTQIIKDVFEFYKLTLLLCETKNIDHIPDCASEFF